VNVKNLPFLARICLFVCPSVRPSVTRDPRTVQDIEMHRAMPIVSWCQISRN